MTHKEVPDMGGRSSELERRAGGADLGRAVQTGGVKRADHAEIRTERSAKRGIVRRVFLRAWGAMRTRPGRDAANGDGGGG